MALAVFVRAASIASQIAIARLALADDIVAFGAIIAIANLSPLGAALLPFVLSAREDTSASRLRLLSRCLDPCLAILAFWLHGRSGLDLGVLLLVFLLSTETAFGRALLIRDDKGIRVSQIALASALVRSVSTISLLVSGLDLNALLVAWAIQLSAEFALLQRARRFRVRLERGRDGGGDTVQGTVVLQIVKRAAQFGDYLIVPLLVTDTVAAAYYVAFQASAILGSIYIEVLTHVDLPGISKRSRVETSQVEDPVIPAFLAVLLSPLIVLVEPTAEMFFGRELSKLGVLLAILLAAVPARVMLATSVLVRESTGMLRPALGIAVARAVVSLGALVVFLPLVSAESAVLLTSVFQVPLAVLFISKPPGTKIMLFLGLLSPLVVAAMSSSSL